MIKVISKFISTLKQRLVCTIFFATILLPLRTHFSANYSLIFLRVFILIFPIISPTNTPRMMNQSIQSTLQLRFLPFLHFILTIQLTFLKYFQSSLFFMQLQDFHHNDCTGHTKGPMAENDGRIAGGPEALNYPEPARFGEYLQLLPLFLGSPGRKQSEPLPTFKTCQLVIPG